MEPSLITLQPVEHVVQSLYVGLSGFDQARLNKVFQIVAGRALCSVPRSAVKGCAITITLLCGYTEPPTFVAE
jgi:hypothetical protein